jgi:catechol 2,3-dioxygenase-like lactoylglutathione lyase family enzyme
MLTHFDHVTVVVRDLARAKEFFAVLGFAVEQDVVIDGPRFARYMGVEGIEANHVTLVRPGAEPRLEVQLLHYLTPRSALDAGIRDLGRVGYNHVCFAVDDLDTLVGEMRAHGFATRGDVLDFHGRRLVFLEGPEGISVELAEWK